MTEQVVIPEPTRLDAPSAPTMKLHFDGLSRPLESPRLRVLSLGAGVQSTTLALMAARGELGAMPDCAIFADTQSEPEAVYRHLDWLEGVLPFPVHRVTAGSLRQELLDASAGVANAYGRPAFFVRNRKTGDVALTRRQCTQDYKLEPIFKKVRELLGLRPRQHSPKIAVVEQWIGISTDEIQRLKHSWSRFIHNRHPLIEARMSRRDCLTWLAERQYPTPPKSACTFCPFHTNAMWRDLRDNDPDAWADALLVDEALARGLNSLREPAFLHRSLKRLADAPIDVADIPGFDFANECEGMCGV